MTKVVETLRARYSAELQEAESRVKAIRAKLVVLDEIAAEEKQIGGTVAATEKRQAAPSSREPLPSTPTEAARFIVDKYGVNCTSLTTKQVRLKMREHGFVESGTNFQSILNVTLKRLAANDRILSDKSGKKPAFRTNPLNLL